MAAGTMRAGNRIYNDLSGLVASDTIGDRGGASRFFYCAKASRAERGEDNDHPTVKPLELMRHFVRLITPPGGTVLDITMGSGTTMLAAQAEGFGAIGIEIDGKSYRIARKRLRTDAPLFANLERSSA
ncbi:MAG: site-specific DNA-methyltransferase [Polyangiaceae bacterium]|nr:site-specific DNA-methyltransferase [Polyangiaceae bacterium]